MRSYYIKLLAPLSQGSEGSLHDSSLRRPSSISLKDVSSETSGPISIKFHMVLLLCSHSPNDVPPEPQRNVSISAVRGAVRPSKNFICVCVCVCMCVYSNSRNDVPEWLSGTEPLPHTPAACVRPRCVL